MFKSSIRAIHTSLRRFLRDDGGATAIEYAMIASGISVAIAATIIGLGSNVNAFYAAVAAVMN